MRRVFSSRSVKETSASKSSASAFNAKPKACWCASARSRASTEQNALARRRTSRRSVLLATAAATASASSSSDSSLSDDPTSPSRASGSCTNTRRARCLSARAARTCAFGEKGSPRNEAPLARRRARSASAAATTPDSAFVVRETSSVAVSSALAKEGPSCASRATRSVSTSQTSARCANGDGGEAEGEGVDAEEGPASRFPVFVSAGTRPPREASRGGATSGSARAAVARAGLPKG